MSQTIQATIVTNRIDVTVSRVVNNGGSGSISNTDQLPEGSSNLYFTAARVLASLLAGLSTATGTAGSNETIQSYLRKNDTTDTSIQDVGNTDSVKVFSNTNLNVSVIAGDVLTMKMIYPTWGTNPANVRRSGIVVIEVNIP